MKSESSATSVFCKHYHGLRHARCDANVELAQFTHGRTPHDLIPCFNPTTSQACPHAVYPTAEEIEEQDRQVAEKIKQWEADLDHDICPSCKQSITMKQVGRCVYGSCGHRLYQGRLPKRHQPLGYHFDADEEE